MSDREKRLLLLLIPAVLAVVIRYAFFNSDSSVSAPSAVVAADSAPVAEKRLAKLRQVAATVPAKQTVLNEAEAELKLRERGIIIAETAAQAQAHLLEVVRREGKAENIDVRGGELGQLKKFDEYGEASVSVTFDCHINEFVNFIAAMSHEPELIGPQELHIHPINPKEKTINVRMTLAGLVPKKLVPEKKGFSF